MAACSHTTDKLASPNSQTGAIQKTYLLTKNTEEFSGRKFRRKDQQAEKDQIERVTGLGRRTREEIAKWNQTTALRFQTGGRHQTYPASLRGVPERPSQISIISDRRSNQNNGQYLLFLPTGKISIKAKCVLHTSEKGVGGAFRES